MGRVWQARQRTLYWGLWLISVVQAAFPVCTVLVVCVCSCCRVPLWPSLLSGVQELSVCVFAVPNSPLWECPRRGFPRPSGALQFTRSQSNETWLYVLTHTVSSVDSGTITT